MAREPDVTDQADALNEGLHPQTTFVVGRQTLAETLDRVATLACDAVAGADVAGLTLVSKGRPTTSVHTDPTSPEIDEAQYEAYAGPGIDALKRGETLRVDSTESEKRWPEFRGAARQHGILSTLSMPLLVESEPVGGPQSLLQDRAGLRQSTGMLMAAQGCNEDEAFDLLVRASQRCSRKLRDIAQKLVDRARQRRAASPPPTDTR